jgi:Flp pilus assembly protein TadG
MEAATKAVDNPRQMAGDAHPESGQAAVETALTMPLALFMVLGTLQLFMLLQGRLFAEHAAYSAVRTGVVKHGDCEAMTHAAIAALLPSFISFLGEGTPGASPEDKMVNAFLARTRNKPFQNQFDPTFDDGHDGAVVWLFRETPLTRDVTRDSEDDFDDPDTQGYVLSVRLVYWYPLRIPFANWVMATMYRAYFGLGDYTKVNPIMPTMPNAAWTQRSTRLRGAAATEFQRRYNAEQYVFPVTASYAMRMMTPPRRNEFIRQDCEPAP